MTVPGLPLLALIAARRRLSMNGDALEIQAQRLKMDRRHRRHGHQRMRQQHTAK